MKSMKRKLIAIVALVLVIALSMPANVKVSAAPGNGHGNGNQKEKNTIFVWVGNYSRSDFWYDYYESLENAVVTINYYDSHDYKYVGWYPFGEYVYDIKSEQTSTNARGYASFDIQKKYNVIESVVITVNGEEVKKDTNHGWGWDAKNRMEIEEYINVNLNNQPVIDDSDDDKTPADDDDDKTPADDDDDKTPADEDDDKTPADDDDDKTPADDDDDKTPADDDDDKTPVEDDDDKNPVEDDNKQPAEEEVGEEISDEKNEEAPVAEGASVQPEAAAPVVVPEATAPVQTTTSNTTVPFIILPAWSADNDDAADTTEELVDVDPTATPEGAVEDEEPAAEETPAEEPVVEEPAAEEETVDVELVETAQGAVEDEEPAEEAEVEAEAEDLELEATATPQGDTLPQTGVLSAAVFYGLGSICVAIGGTVVAKIRRKEEE